MKVYEEVKHNDS
jgi:hypothetical protein